MDACSPWLFSSVAVVAQEVDGLAVAHTFLHSNLYRSSLAASAKFLGEVRLVMIVPPARTPRSFFQQVKESDRIVKPNHEQDVVLIGEMGVHRKIVDNPALELRGQWQSCTRWV